MQYRFYVLLPFLYQGRFATIAEADPTKLVKCHPHLSNLLLTVLWRIICCGSSMLHIVMCLYFEQYDRLSYSCLLFCFVNRKIGKKYYVTYGAAVLS